MNGRHVMTVIALTIWVIPPEHIRTIICKGYFGSIKANQLGLLACGPHAKHEGWTILQEVHYLLS